MTHESHWDGCYLNRNTLAFNILSAMHQQFLRCPWKHKINMLRCFLYLKHMMSQTQHQHFLKILTWND